MKLRAPHSVLFVCERNAGRSQIAAAFFNQLADPGLAVATSAGLNAERSVYPGVLAAMREVGIDLSSVVPHELTGKMLTDADFVVTLGCAERCPMVPVGRRADWRLPDPKDMSVERVRVLRENVRQLVEELIREKGWGRPLS